MWNCIDSTVLSIISLHIHSCRRCTIVKRCGLLKCFLCTAILSLRAAFLIFFPSLSFPPSSVTATGLFSLGCAELAQPIARTVLFGGGSVEVHKIKLPLIKDAKIGHIITLRRILLKYHNLYTK